MPTSLRLREQVENCRNVHAVNTRRCKKGVLDNRQGQGLLDWFHFRRLSKIEGRL